MTLPETWEVEEESCALLFFSSWNGVKEGTDRGKNTETITSSASGSFCSFFLFMLFCRVATVSSGVVGRRVSLWHSHSAFLRENESDGEAKPFCCCLIHILCAPPWSQLWYLPAVSQYPPLITSALCQPCAGVVMHGLLPCSWHTFMICKHFKSKIFRY